jgi:hypothetical protein
VEECNLASFEKFLPLYCVIKKDILDLIWDDEVFVEPQMPIECEVDPEGYGL